MRASLIAMVVCVSTTVCVDFADAGPSARRTTRYSRHLRAVSEYWSREAQRQGHYNTSRELRNISDLTRSVDSAVRQGSLTRARRAVDGIIDTSIDMRQYIRLIDSRRFQDDLRDDLGSYVNRLASEVFEEDWQDYGGSAGDSTTTMTESGEQVFQSWKRLNEEAMADAGEFEDDLADDENSGDDRSDDQNDSREPTNEGERDAEGGFDR